jgi:shikimate kinase
LGGGSLVNEQSQIAAKKAGQLFYLHLPYNELYKRMQTAPLPSYLSNKEEAFERLFTERHSLFSQLADETIFLQAHTAEQVLNKICSHNWLTRENRIFSGRT